jgi:hypothetical protein
MLAVFTQYLRDTRRVCFGDRAAPMPPKSKADFIKVSARLTHRAAAAR